MDDRIDVDDDVIRCELGGADRRTTGELLRSLVHHHCARCDVAVELVEALDAALDDLLDSVWRRWNGVASIEMGSSCRRLDLHLIGPSDQLLGAADRSEPTGPIVAALFDEVNWEHTSKLLLSCDLQEGGHR